MGGAWCPLTEILLGCETGRLKSTFSFNQSDLRLGHTLLALSMPHIWYLGKRSTSRRKRRRRRRRRRQRGWRRKRRIRRRRRRNYRELYGEAADLKYKDGDNSNNQSVRLKLDNVDLVLACLCLTCSVTTRLLTRVLRPQRISYPNRIIRNCDQTPVSADVARLYVIKLRCANLFMFSINSYHCFSCLHDFLNFWVTITKYFDSAGAVRHNAFLLKFQYIAPGSGVWGIGDTWIQVA